MYNYWGSSRKSHPLKEEEVKEKTGIITALRILHELEDKKEINYKFYKSLPKFAYEYFLKTGAHPTMRFGIKIK